MEYVVQCSEKGILQWVEISGRGCILHDCAYIERLICLGTAVTK